MRENLILYVLISVAGFAYTHMFWVKVFGYQGWVLRRFPMWVFEGVHAIAGFSVVLMMLILSEAEPVHPAAFKVSIVISVVCTLKLLAALILIADELSGKGVRRVQISR